MVATHLYSILLVAFINKGVFLFSISLVPLFSSQFVSYLGEE